MATEQDESERNLDRWLDSFRGAGIRLAALAVVRKGDCNVTEAAVNISEYTAGMMTVDEPRLAEVLRSLEGSGYIERRDGRYTITAAGKRHMYVMLKQWNRYVDAMNNLWGCYYGT
jgi:DNA-binding PadR family transcriptional regulator